MSNALGHKIRDRRKNLGQTQGEAAPQFKVTQQTVASWESGKRPSPEHFDRIASYLQLPREDVVQMIFPPTEQAESDMQSEIKALRSELSEIRDLLQAFAAANKQSVAPARKKQGRR